MIERKPDILDAVMRPILLRKEAEAIDRSALGRFASPAEVFVAHWVFDHLYDERRTDTTQAHRNALENISLECKDLDVKYGVNTFTSRINIRTEMSFFGYKSEHMIDMDWFTKLGLITDSPEDYYDYFSQGIWDVETIRRFVANGIDANLAAAAI